MKNVLLGIVCFVALVALGLSIVNDLTYPGKIKDIKFDAFLDGCVFGIMSLTEEPSMSAKVEGYCTVSAYERTQGKPKTTETPRDGIWFIQ